MSDDVLNKILNLLTVIVGAYLAWRAKQTDKKTDQISQKADQIDKKADQIHVLTNDNLNKVTTKLSVLEERNDGLHLIVGTLRAEIEGLKATAAALAATITQPAVVASDTPLKVAIVELPHQIAVKQSSPEPE